MTPILSRSLRVARSRTLGFLICGFGLAVFSIMSTACEARDSKTAPRRDDRQSLEQEPVAGLNLSDVTGEHNPRMIAIWGGELTKESWFLQSESWGRISELTRGLEHFCAYFRRLPNSVDELEDQGFLPIRPTDPVSGQPICYGEDPSANDDFVHVGVTCYASSWAFCYQYPKFPDGRWAQVEEEFEAPKTEEDFCEQLRSRYPSIRAMRGALLASMLNMMVYYYVWRRNKMPTTAEEMLDGLWYVSANWARDTEAVDPTEPGSFLFSLDRSMESAFAAWRDEEGYSYQLQYRYSPWPTGGWNRVPTLNEYYDRFQTGQYGTTVGMSSETDSPISVPGKVIWTCKLL